MPKVVAKPAQTRSNKISSSSLTSVASSTNSLKNSSDLKSTRETRNRNRQTTYYEMSDDLSANGTDDDNVQTRPKRAKRTSEEKGKDYSQSIPLGTFSRGKTTSEYY